MSHQVWSNYQKYIFKSRYARWLDEEGRRETWEETVWRYFSFFYDKIEGADPCAKAGTYDLNECRDAVLSLEVMPSMRALMSAGKALERDHVAGFNCSYVAVDNIRSFDETMYILMCGTGVGFSVERQYISRLPIVPEVLCGGDKVIRVKDSKIGWAESFKALLQSLYLGRVPQWDLSHIRASGERLKTFGGRASGPKPLEDLFRFTVEVFKRAVGRRLNSLECHDLMCKIGDVVVCGGVRRSALISLSNLSDDRMRKAKTGAWIPENPQRMLANNSVAYTEKPDLGIFMKEWSSLYESKNGERGFFNRVASQIQAGRNGRSDSTREFGTNPCSEIILRPNQFCNLTEVVVRSGDTLDDLKRKVRLATILGTLQSTLTDFRYLRKIWKDNTEEERLLGVSLTGIMDHPVLSGETPWNLEGEWPELPQVLEEIKEVAIETNKEWSSKLGIQASSAITCVKPSGTVSQLVDSSSGIHSRFSLHYIRRVRSDAKDPLTAFLIASGVPYEVDNHNPTAMVFSFPCRAPEGAHTVSEDTAIGQLELWKIYQEHWCEHKPSITVYYTPDEFLEVGAWVYKNFDSISGVSFLPKSDHVYEQAPYTAIDEDTYNKLVEEMPDIDWELFNTYEDDDNTVGAQTLACSGGVCEL